ncbi:SH3-like domain-containing protein [Bacillus cereus]|uniref:GW dipeptide domain-containing protein n=1 Tax=Bacillus pseudomycoides TaxID=64104 RepID=UPI003000611C
MLGWIDLKNGINKHTFSESIGTGVAIMKGNVNGSHGIWTKPYGEEDAKWVAPVSDFSNKSVKVLQKVTIFSASGVGTTWCKIQDGKRVLGWVDAKTLLDRSIYKQDRYAVIGNGNGHAIWSTPYGLEGARNLGNVSDYANNFAHIDKNMKVADTISVSHKHRWS